MADHPACLPLSTFSLVPLTNSCSSRVGTASSAAKGHPTTAAMANPSPLTTILFVPPSTGAKLAAVPSMTPHMAKVEGRKALAV